MLWVLGKQVEGVSVGYKLAETATLLAVRILEYQPG